MPGLQRGRLVGLQAKGPQLGGAVARGVKTTCRSATASRCCYSAGAVRPASTARRTRAANGPGSAATPSATCAVSTLRALPSSGQGTVASGSRCATGPVICARTISARVAGHGTAIEAAVCSIAPAVLEGSRNARPRPPAPTPSTTPRSCHPGTVGVSGHHRQQTRLGGRPGRPAWWRSRPGARPARGGEHSYRSISPRPPRVRFKSKADDRHKALSERERPATAASSTP